LNFFRHSGIYYDFSQHHKARMTPSAAIHGRAGCISFYIQQYGRAGVPLSTTSSMDVQGVSKSIAVQGVCIPFHLCKMIYKCPNAGLSGIWSVWYRNEKIPMPETVSYRNNRSGTAMLHYRTEIPDAGIGIACQATMVCNASERILSVYHQN
jgi:hypothetical protein